MTENTRTVPPSDELAEERLVRQLDRIARDLEHVLGAVLVAGALLALILGVLILRTVIGL